MSAAERSRGYLASALTCRCPRCREGKLFKNPVSFSFKKTMEMNKTCPVCGQPTEIEVGFYYGTSYVSYALTVAISVATLIAWWQTIGLSTEDNRFFLLAGIQCCIPDSTTTLVDEAEPQFMDFLVCTARSRLATASAC